MKQRVLTALALAPVVLGTVFLSSPWPLILLGSVAVFICVDEVQKMVHGFAPLGLVTMGYLGIAVSVIVDQSRTPILLLGTALGMLAMWEVASSGEAVAGFVRLLLACLWIVCPVASLSALHAFGRPVGTWTVATPALLAILPLWGGDTAAIFAGRAFGKHLLAPSISPKKTVEGALANLFVCVLVSVPLGLSLGYTTIVGIACGLAAGTFGQMGDLFESAIKRRAGVKDSGILLPGHGGLLDRIDSLLLTAPVVATILVLPGARS